MLPNGYTQLEYIQSSGTQYIDTGFPPNQNGRIVVDFDLLTQNTAYTGLFGCRTSGNSGFLVFARTGSPAYQSDFGTEQLYSDGTAYGRHIIDKNKLSFFVDGVLKSTHTSTSLSVGYNAFLFAINKAGSAMSGYICTARLYSCQIYDNDTMIRDYVPCRTSGGEVGLYDLVGGEFYGNAGMGTFTAGPENTTSRYTVLEYIQSSGAQYVNSCFNPRYNTRIVMDVGGVPNQSPQMFFGSKNADSATASLQFSLFRNSATTIRSDYFSTNAAVTVADTTGRTTIDKNANVVTMYGVTLTNTAVSSGEVPYPLYIMALNTAGSVTAPATGKLYSCQIYDNGTLTRDYIPVRYWNGMAGLYDKANDLFYPPQGTGYFTEGPEATVDPPGTFYTVLSVNLRWGTVDCEGYRLYRNDKLIVDTKNTAYTDESVVSGMDYVYKITAYNGSNESDPVTLEVSVREGYTLLRPVVQTAFFQ